MQSNPTSLSKRPHIIFVYPPATSTTKQHVSGLFQMCLGSASIIAYLLEKGFSALQYETDAPINVGECVRQILARKPAAVGFTVYGTNYCSCQAIARSLKQANPGIVILFGGPTATVQSEIVLKTNEFVDICVREEGEETCGELLSALDDARFDLDNAALENIKGIGFRRDRRILENRSRNIIHANREIPNYLDTYPSPYLSGVVQSGKLGIVTARGCSRHCVYCNCAVLSKRSIAAHSVDRVIVELDYIQKNIYDNYFVDIFDDAFTLLPERALEICNRIIEHKIKLPLSCATRCDCIDEELLEKMKEAGFKAVGFSLESAVPRLLRIIGKVQPPHTASDDDFEKEKEFIEKFRRYITYAKKIGIETVYTSIMIGLPTETPEEARQTVNLVRSLGDTIDYYAHNIFQVYPGTPIFHTYKKYGLQLQAYDNRVHHETVHNFDTGRIKPAPRANVEIEGSERDKAHKRTLALCLTGKRNFNYFDKLILAADTITKELMKWLQAYQAVNGEIIQIYSSLERARQHRKQNEQMIKAYRSPRESHDSYYPVPTQDGVTRLIPVRTLLLGKRCGTPINRVGTCLALSEAHNTCDPRASFCLENTREDTLALHRYLVEAGQKDNPFQALSESPLTPHFANLCRWEKIGANCRSPEILIVDGEDNIRTCWHGQPVGKVGTPYPEIIENLKSIHRAVETRRGCQECPKKQVCTRCIFPQPLAEQEYCRLKKSSDSEEAAELLRTLEMFKR